MEMSAVTSADEDLTYWSWLSKQESSVWDLLSGDPLGGVDPNGILSKPKMKKPDVFLDIGIRDLNNTEESPYENKPKPAIEVGVNISF